MKENNKVIDRHSQALNKPRFRQEAFVLALYFGQRIRLDKMQNVDAFIQ